MKEKLIFLAKEKGFVSNIIGKSVESIYSKKDYYYLWMCELQKWLWENHHIEVQSIFNTGLYRRLRKASNLKVDNFRYNIICNTDKEDAFEEFSSDDNYNNYQKGLEAGLYRSLNIIK